MFVAIFLYFLLVVTFVAVIYQVKFCFEMFDEPVYRFIVVIYLIFVLAVVCFFIYMLPYVFNWR